VILAAALHLGGGGVLGVVVDRRVLSWARVGRRSPAADPGCFHAPGVSMIPACGAGGVSQPAALSVTTWSGLTASSFAVFGLDQRCKLHGRAASGVEDDPFDRPLTFFWTR
jgi:hypothetical protein